MFVASQKLRKCKKGLKVWSRDHFGNVQKNIRQLKDQLWRAKEVSARFGNSEEVAQLKKELNVYWTRKNRCGSNVPAFNG